MTPERKAERERRTAELEDTLLALSREADCDNARINAAYKLHTIYNGMPVAKQENVPPPLTPEQQAERQRVQAEMLRLLQAAAKPEPLTIEARPAEEQAVTLAHRRGR
jgi:hypothetical protein